jgi:hypothetical protein
MNMVNTELGENSIIQICPSIVEKLILKIQYDHVFFEDDRLP